MIITCQNCHTHYSISADAIGPGKAVRCNNCGNSWHQNPVYAAAPPPPAPAAYPPPPAYPQQYAAPPPPPPPMPEAPPPMAEAPPPMPEPEPEPMPEPETEFEPMPDPDMAPEPESMPDLGPEADAEGDAGAEMAAMAEDDAEEGGEDAPDLSPEQLDELFGDNSETDAFQSLSGSGAGAAEGDGVDDLEGLDEPEPIPQVFSPDDEGPIDDDVGGGRGKIIAIAIVVVLVLALGGGVYFGKSFIVGLWPGAADVYAMVGLGGDELGVGLDIRNIKSSRQVEGGVDVLVVRGTVANISDKDRRVPMIRVALYDGSGNEVQSAVTAPLKNRLPAGAEIRFQAKVAEPSALARRLEVTFTAGEKPAH